MPNHNYIELFRENERRNKLLFEKYDPERGINSPVERFEFRIHPNVPLIYLPLTMKNIPFMEQVCKFKTLWDAVQEIYESEHEKHLSELISDIATERIKHDFEFWAYTCVDIQDKITKKLIDFILNKPQRKLLGRLERMRLEGRPIRYILLKARQWGGSTLTQLYMAWIQLFHMTRWHSAIVTDVEQQANNIRGMYSTMALNHPKDVMDVELRPYQGSTKNKTVTGRDNAICVGSMQQPDNLRSFDFAMVHVSEVGLFKKTKGKSPEDLVQSLTGTIPDVHLSLIALESTAKGVGNFFHTEWLAAKNNLSGYEAIFVAWFEIEMYWKKITNGLTRFVDNMNEYDWFQWRSGATLEGINWYKNHKRNLHWSDWRMQSEFPTNDIEAFGSTGRRAFAPMYVQRARQYNRPPEFIGELRGDAMFGKEALNNITFEEDSKGSCKIWAMPDNTIKVKNRYLVSVDIGGRTDVADYSVIRVFDRLQLIYGGVPEAILTWKDHCFVPGTQIYTSNGFKNIEDVKLGDLVWTHKNRFRQVIRTYKNEYNGEIVNIRSKGNYETVSCTPEHPFYSNDVVVKSYRQPWRDKYQQHKKEFIGAASWIKASDLKFVGYSRELQVNDITQFVINKYNGGKSKDTERIISDLKTFYSIIGYYLAEGHINKRYSTGVPSSICFSFSYNEINTVAKDCYDKLIKLGFKASILPYKSVGVCRVRANDTNLAKLMLDLCGEHSWGKILSPIILSSEKGLLSELIKCYWAGDGSVYSTDNSISNTVSTVSEVLARQIRDILIILGHRPGIYKVIAKTKGNGIKSIRPRYNIVWSASEIKANKSLYDDNNVLYRVSKTISNYSGYVYNLEVEDDNSYSTACYIVHNCDQDLVIWKAAQIGKFYNDALLAPETNSLRAKQADSEGDHIITVLDEILPFYPYIYMRTDPEKVRAGAPARYGFHTNPKTKTDIINTMNRDLREEGYIEYDSTVCDEYDCYEIKPDGSYGAVEGQHDDLAMCTMIGKKVSDLMPLPVLITEEKTKEKKTRIISEASF